MKRTYFLESLLLAAIVTFFSIIVSGKEVDARSDAAQSVPVPYKGKLNFDDATHTRTSHYLTMQDGIKIAIDLYLPKGLNKGEKLPTILHQTRYWRSIDYRWPASRFKEKISRGLIGTFAKRFIANGYAWVDVDVRGSGASFGYRPFAYSPAEIQDGAEVVNWIVHQSWSNGRIGALGISYGGAAAELLLVNQHPAVKAVAPLFSGFDLYPEIGFPGGIHLTWFTKTWSYINGQLDQNMLPFETWMTRLFVRGVLPVDADSDRSLLILALHDHKNNWSPHQEALSITFRDDTPHSPNISNIDILSTRWHEEEISGSDAAIYSYSGWFDGGYQLAAIKRHLSHTHAGNKLIVGPWDHGGKRNISPFSQGPSEFDHQGELLKFFDYHLKGLDTGIVNESPIHYFTMGEESWKATDVWPPKTIRSSYFLGPNHSLSDKATDRRPATNISRFDQYVVDSTVGTGEQTRWDTLIGKSLTNPYADRTDRDRKLILYTSVPLDQDVEVTGHPLLTLYMSTNAPDATVFAYLEDVDEDGHVTYVTEGMLRALHRKLDNSPTPYSTLVPHRSFKKVDALPLPPGEVTTLLFDLLPTSYQFKKGHHIRLALAGSDKDHFASLPGDSPTLTIFFSDRYPSHLELPIVQ